MDRQGWRAGKEQILQACDSDTDTISQVVATDYRDLNVTFEEMGKSGQLMMRVINKYV